MSQSIKLDNNTYIDASGVWDSSINTTLDLLSPKRESVGKIVDCGYDTFALNFFNSKDTSYAPQFDYFDIGGPVTGCIYMKHSDFHGGVMILLSYRFPRPVFMKFYNGEITDEYYL